MGFFDNFLTGGADDYEGQLQNGINSVNNSYNQATGFMNPFMQFGMGEMGQYGQGVNAMSNPNQFINNLMQNYQMSPQAQFQTQQGDQGMNAAAAASGTLGSGPEQKSLAAYNQNLTNNDQSNYLNQRLGVYNNFLTNAGNMTNMGYGAAGQMGNWSMDQGADLAQLYNQMGMGQMYGAQNENGLFGQAAGWAAGKF